MIISSVTRSHLSIFCLLILMGVALRFLALDALSGTIYYSVLLPDEQYYHNWALSLLSGEASSQPFDYAPLPAYVMALVYKLFAVDISLIRIGNIFLNMSGCVFVYLITRRLCSPGWALLGLGLAIGSGELIFYSIVPLKTSLSFFLFALLIYLLVRACRHGSHQLLLIVGLVLGIEMNVRPNVIILLPAIILVLMFLSGDGLGKTKRIRYCVFLVIGFFLTALPLTYHNFLQSKQFSFLPVQSGFLFYCANTTDNPTPRYRPVPFASSHPEEQGIHFVIEASRRTGKSLDAKQASRYWQLQVVREAMVAPTLALKKAWEKGKMLFSFQENGDHYDIGFMAEFFPFFRILKLRYGWFLVLGYAGLFFGFARSREIRVLTCVSFAYLLTLFLYSTGNRFALPLLAILIPVSVWNCSYVVKVIKGKMWRSLMASCVVMGGLVYLGFCNSQSSRDLSLHYNTMAFFYNQKGDVDSAMKYWHKSASLQRTYSDTALLFLAGRNYQLKGPASAIETLEKIDNASFMAAAKFATLGDIYKHHKRFSDALVAYRTSIEINGGQKRVRKEIIDLLLRSNSGQVEVERKELEWVDSFYW